MIRGIKAFFRNRSDVSTEIKPGFTLYMAGQTDTGRAREHNEDAVSWDLEHGLAMLADGMGGHSAGDVASRLCLESLMAELDSALEKPRALATEDDLGPQASLLQRAVINANKTVCRAAQENASYQGMGTTLVTLLFYSNQVVVAHVGDSRAYRLRGGKMQQITSDHSLIQEMLDRGLMTDEQAEDSSYSHVVTRAIGADEFVAPDVQELELHAGDIFLLCSDGLTDLVDDEAIADTLRAASGNWERATQHLIDLANQNGGTDNISVVLVAVGDPRE